METLEQTSARRHARLYLREAMQDARELGVSYLSMAQLALRLAEEESDDD